MKKKLFALSGVFLIVLVIAGLWATQATDINSVQQTAPATSSLASGMSMEQMVEQSSLILIGKVLGTRSQWVEGRRLVTVATVLVEEPLKGGVAAGTEVSVVLPGGIGSKGKFPLAMTYAGAPHMSESEEVIVFLTEQDDVANGYSVMGFAAGKYSINKTSDGQKVVMRDMSKEPVQNVSGLMRGNPQAVLLSEFKGLVESLLKK